MEEIKRYDYDEGDGNWRFPGHVQRKEGDWVMYRDHTAAVEKLKAEIASLREALAQYEADSYNEQMGEE